MDVLTSETCWAWNNEIKKQVTSSWSPFIQAVWLFVLFSFSVAAKYGLHVFVVRYIRFYFLFPWCYHIWWHRMWLLVQFILYPVTYFNPSVKSLYMNLSALSTDLRPIHYFVTQLNFRLIPKFKNWEWLYCFDFESVLLVSSVALSSISDRIMLTYLLSEDKNNDII